MKKCVAIFTILALLGVVGLAGELKDGRYASQTKLLDVVVVIKDGQIHSIDITKHRGGGEAYLSPLHPLVRKILDKQSTDVDSVTGATASSEALKSAVGDCLKQAGK